SRPGENHQAGITRRRQEFRERKGVIGLAKAIRILFAWHCSMVILYLSGRGANDIAGTTHCLPLGQTNPFFIRGTCLAVALCENGSAVNWFHVSSHQDPA